MLSFFLGIGATQQQLSTCSHSRVCLHFDSTPAVLHCGAAKDDFRREWDALDGRVAQTVYLFIFNVS
jgi:hypothetical protein